MPSANTTITRSYYHDKNDPAFMSKLNQEFDKVYEELDRVNRAGTNNLHNVSFNVTEKNTKLVVEIKLNNGKTKKATLDLI
jgi:hypothetical protein